MSIFQLMLFFRRNLLKGVMFYCKSLAASAFLIFNSHKNVYNHFLASATPEDLYTQTNNQTGIVDFPTCFINPHAEVARRSELYGEWDPEWDGEIIQKPETKESELSDYSKLIIFVSKADCKLKNEEKKLEVNKLCKRLSSVLKKNGLLDPTIFTKLVHANDNFSRDTANIMYQNLKVKTKPQESYWLGCSGPYPLLCEPYDVASAQLLKQKKINFGSLEMEESRGKAAFEDAFKRANKLSNGSMELYVCSKEVVNMMLCYSLQLPIERCNSFQQDQGLSYTVFKINGKGHVTCQTFANLAFSRTEENKQTSKPSKC